MITLAFKFSAENLEKILLGLAFSGDAAGLVSLIHHYAAPQYESRQDAHAAGMVVVNVLAKFFIPVEFVITEGEGGRFGFEMSVPEREVTRLLGKAVAA